MHNGILPREGFRMDTVMKLVANTALNPSLLLPLILLARFTKKGQDLSILNPVAFSRVKTLFWLGLARQVSSYLSRQVLNNWVADEYDWDKEIVLITGGAGGIGGHVAQLLGVSISCAVEYPFEARVSGGISTLKKETTNSGSSRSAASRWWCWTSSR